MVLLEMIRDSTSGIFCNRGERLVVGYSCSSWLMMGGTVPGVLLRVVQKCVCLAALCVVGAVGFVVVVVGGALLTLSIVAPPSEVGTRVTL